MLRFLAFIWDDQNPEQTAFVNSHCARLQADEADWSTGYQASGSLVLCADCKPDEFHVLPDNAGILIGQVFRQTSSGDDSCYSRFTNLTSGEARDLIARGPICLANLLWGWFVSISRTQNGTSVFRSAMSDVPCFHSSVHGVHIFYSRPEDLRRLRIVPFTFDYEMVQLLVGFGRPAVYGQSAIREIEPIHMGESVDLSRGGIKRQLLWKPAELVQSPRNETHGALASRLRSKMKRCVHAWASQHDSILLRLSGGLDSSLVLHCLIDAPNRPRITCLNYYWPGRKGDERQAARTAVADLDVTLIERELGTSRSLRIVDTVECTAAPVMDSVEWQESEREHDLIRSMRATAVFMGSLGDGIFEIDPGPACLADYVLLHRAPWSRELFQVLHDIAINQRVSVWAVLKHTILGLMERRSRSRWSYASASIASNNFDRTNALVPPEHIGALLRLSLDRTHPWTANAKGISESKLWQIHSLYVDKFYDAPFRAANAPPIVPPFLSQPLVDFCLQVPSYQNTHRGRDRALVRTAFAEVLPHGILRRRGKGSPVQWLRAMTERDSSFVRDYLLGGALARERVIDSDRLEQALPGSLTRVAHHSGSLMHLLFTEAWIRAWESSGSAMLRSN